MNIKLYTPKFVEDEEADKANKNPYSNLIQNNDTNNKFKKVILII